MRKGEDDSLNFIQILGRQIATQLTTENDNTAQFTTENDNTAQFTTENDNTAQFTTENGNTTVFWEYVLIYIHKSQLYCVLW